MDKMTLIKALTANGRDRILEEPDELLDIDEYKERVYSLLDCEPNGNVTVYWVVNEVKNLSEEFLRRSK